MLDGFDLLNACRRMFAAVAVAGAALAFATAPATAQQVILLVNGDPITSFDIEQRTRFLTLLNNGKTPTRDVVVDELIDERLKLQLTRRFDFSSVNLDGDVDSAIANLARRQSVPVKVFADQLATQGVQLGTLKSRLKAELIWTQVVRGKYQGSYNPNEEEILKAAGDKEDQVGYDYTLRPITFVVRRGSPPAIFEARKREAEGLRVRFQNCPDGLAFARGLPEVTIRPEVTSRTSELAPGLREILEKTEVGKLTPPEVTMQSVEVYAVCGKKASSAENSPLKRQAREQLLAERFQANAKKYLKELRSQAWIVYK